MSRPRSSSRGAPDFEVEAKLEELLIGGTMSYWVVFLPKRLQDKAPFAARRRLRMRGVVNGEHPVAMAWQLSGGRHYVMFGRALAKSLKLELGAKVKIAFAIADESDVEVPSELEEALRQEPAWKALWDELTPGKQRGLAHMVRAVKSPDLRAQRAVDILRSVEDGVIPGPPRRRAR